MDQLDVRVQLNAAKLPYVAISLAVGLERAMDEVKESTVDEAIQIAQTIVELFSCLENTDEEDEAFIRPVYLELGELLFDRHAEKIRNGSASEGDYNRLMYAQTCFEKGLSLSKAQYTESDVMFALKAGFTCEYIYIHTGSKNYLTMAHETVCQAFEKSRQLFSEEEARERDGVYNRELILSIIRLKCMLDDFEGAEKYVSEYSMSGASQEEIESWKEFIQEGREQRMPKRKKFLGLF